MLELAILHVDELQYRYGQTLSDDRYKYFCRNAGIPLSLQIENDTWNELQFASIDEGKVIGYLGAKLNRLTKTGYDIEAINFLPRKHSTFTSDIYALGECLFFQHGMNRMTFSVVVGNPAEKFYDRLVKSLGVRIVGIFKEDVMLPDGKLYDLKFYELFKEDLLGAGATAENYRDRRWDNE